MVTLITHMARGNDQIAQLESTGNYIVVFNGKHDSYVSSFWYDQKKINHNVVSTWDYSTVHANGEAKTVSDDKELMLQVLDEVVDDNEGNTLIEEIWKHGNARKSYFEAMVNHVVHGDQSHQD